MGWRDRDYAKWTDEERRRFYGSGTGPSAFGGYDSSRRARGSRVFRRGVGPAILVSGVVLTLGHVPNNHPIIPALHFRLPGLGNAAAPAAVQRTGTISMGSTAEVGSTLTFHGSAPPGDGPVMIEGSYDGGHSWQTLSSVVSANGSYSAEIALTQRGLLRIRILFADGSQSVGSLVVE